MLYSDKFRPTDELIQEIDALKESLQQDTLSKFTGALSVSAITSFELTIKEIFITYATHKHQVFGNYIQNYLSRLNGRIQINDLKKELKKYNPSLATNFENEIRNMEQHDSGLRSAYQNLIQNRHTYVHENRINLTYEECKADYELGKKIINALSIIMT